MLYQLYCNSTERRSCRAGTRTYRALDPRGKSEITNARSRIHVSGARQFTGQLPFIHIQQSRAPPARTIPNALHFLFLFLTYTSDSRSSITLLEASNACSTSAAARPRPLDSVVRVSRWAVHPVLAHGHNVMLGSTQEEGRATDLSRPRRKVVCSAGLAVCRNAEVAMDARGERTSDGVGCESRWLIDWPHSVGGKRDRRFTFLPSPSFTAFLVSRTFDIN